MYMRNHIIAANTKVFRAAMASANGANNTYDNNYHNTNMATTNTTANTPNTTHHTVTTSGAVAIGDPTIGTHQTYNTCTMTTSNISAVANRHNYTNMSVYNTISESHATMTPPNARHYLQRLRYTLRIADAVGYARVCHMVGIYQVCQYEHGDDTNIIRWIPHTNDTTPNYTDTVTVYNTKRVRLVQRERAFMVMLSRSAVLIIRLY